jgi:4-hydroxy-2-oxoheptanedioate aldolase
MTDKTSTLKEKLKKGEKVAGPWCIIPSATIIEIIAQSGIDFVIVDMEHGAHSFEGLENMLRAAECRGCGTLVRVARNNESDILHALDLGADGVIIPHIQTRSDAEKAIGYTKYYPLGSRGFSPFTRAGGYSRNFSPQFSSIQNDRTILCLILEGSEGIENLDDILSINNIGNAIDIIYIGAYDLSQALGVPGQVDHPLVRNTLSQCIRKINERGVASGGYVAKNLDDLRWMSEMGMQFITLLPDCTIIYHAFESYQKAFHEISKSIKRGK